MPSRFKNGLSYIREKECQASAKSDDIRLNNNHQHKVLLYSLMKNTIGQSYQHIFQTTT